MSDEREIHPERREPGLGSPMDPLRRFIHALARVIDWGAYIPLEETKAAVEEDRLGPLLEGLPEGNPLADLEEKDRVWIVEGLTGAGQLAEGLEAVPFDNGLLWILDLAVDLLYHGEMP